MTYLELVLALGTSAVGALGGLGGAILLVPILVLCGVSPGEAAPLGLVSVAAGSLAAGAIQIREQTVNHRIGVVTELAASSGAVAGALAAGAIDDAWLQRLLAAVAIAGAVLGGRRKGIRNRPDPALGPADVGERPGRLAGAYALSTTEIVPYQACRLPLGLAFMSVAGLIAGLAGASGGFLKTPAQSEIMHVPIRVAAATTTFTIAITASTGLIVMALQGRLDLRACAAVAVGALLGGRFGATLQSRLSPPVVRRTLSALLVAVGLVLLATA